MQICDNCQSKQFDGAIFCSECGGSLLPARRHETTMSLGQRPPTGDLGDPEPMFVPAPDAQPAGPTLNLVIMNSGRRIKLDVSDDLLIGRKDNARGIFPDVDLGLDGGYDAGVSRRHAILSHKDGLYRVEDLGSANGTFVNGRRLTPQVATPLASGDELKCGTLLMRVEFS
jgi:pSer/pThr/pTyr-binding forkhead associated (FHA) protein